MWSPVGLWGRQLPTPPRTFGQLDPISSVGRSSRIGTQRTRSRDGTLARLRTWAVEVRSENAVRPHRLDERVLTSLSEALEADPRVLDADVVGDGPRVGARFDLCADDHDAAIEQARAVFLDALVRAAGSAASSVRAEVRAQEHVRA